MNLFNVDKVSMKPRVSGMFSSCQNCQSISSFSVRNKKIPRNSLQLQSVSKLLTLPVHVASWQAPRIIMAFLFFFYTLLLVWQRQERVQREFSVSPFSSTSLWFVCLWPVRTLSVESDEWKRFSCNLKFVLCTSLAANQWASCECSLGLCAVYAQRVNADSSRPCNVFTKDPTHRRNLFQHETFHAPHATCFSILDISDILTIRPWVVSFIVRPPQTFWSPGGTLSSGTILSHSKTVV